jgi:cytochrome c oxidase subunit 1
VGEGFLKRSFSSGQKDTTTDHKRIAILYAITVTLFFIIGGIAMAIIRLELMTPSGDLLEPNANSACTILPSLR